MNKNRNPTHGKHMLQVVIQMNGQCFEDIFQSFDLIYNGILSKYKNQINTENISRFVFQLDNSNLPILSVFKISDILNLNAVSKEEQQLQQAKNESLIQEEVEKNHHKKIESLEANYQRQVKELTFKYQSQLQTIESQYKTKICQLEEEIESLNNALKGKPESSEIIVQKYGSSLSNSYNKSKEFVDQIIQRKINEIKILEIKGSQIQDQEVEEGQCQICQTTIDSDCPKLSCKHYYHDICFNLLLEQQAISSTYFSCLCDVKIKPKEIYFLQNQQAAQVYQLQMHLNQLKLLKDKLQNVRKCDKKYCSFFYIYDPNKQTGTYCPLCLQ